MGTQYHIKRDGSWLCNANQKSYFYKNDGQISFKEAHEMDLNRPNGPCPDCVKKYFEILDRMPEPVIINK